MLAQIKFEPTVSVGDALSSVGLIFAAAGLFLNWWQLRKDSIRKRAEFITGLYHQHLNDPDTAEMFYRLEYGYFTYPADNFHGSPDEIKLDKLLTYLEKIGRLYEMGALDLEDLDLIKYEFLKVYRHDSITNYFAMLDEGYQSVNVDGRAFDSFRNVARKLHERQLARAQPSG